MSRGWIKTHRKVAEWEWYKVEHCFHLFAHMVLNANRKPKNWRGVEIKRGQLLTTLEKLSEQTGISTQVVRNRLEKFKKSNEIKVESTNKFTVITIVKYEEYQARKRKPTNKQQPAENPTNKKQTKTDETNKQTEAKRTNENPPQDLDLRAILTEELTGRTNKQQTTEQTKNKPIEPKPTLPKEDGKKTRRKEVTPLIPLEDNLPLWIPKEEFLAFVEMRKEIKKPMTQGAISLAIGKLKAYHDLGHSLKAVLNQSIFHNWQDLYEPKENKNEANNYGNGQSARTNRSDLNFKRESTGGNRNQPFSKADQLRELRERGFSQTVDFERVSHDSGENGEDA